MLAKLIAAMSRREADEVPVEHQPAELPLEAMQIKPMVPLQPPPAQNDDVMREVCKEVEKVLRAGGHLR